LKSGEKLELARGIEPPTCGLQNLNDQKAADAENPPKAPNFLDTWLD